MRFRDGLYLEVASGHFNITQNKWPVFVGGVRCE